MHATICFRAVMPQKVHLFGGGLRGRSEPFPVVAHEGDERKLAGLCDVELAANIAIGQKIDGSAMFACFHRSFEHGRVGLAKFFSLTTL